MNCAYFAQLPNDLFLPPTSYIIVVCRRGDQVAMWHSAGKFAENLNYFGKIFRVHNGQNKTAAVLLRRATKLKKAASFKYPSPAIG